jgi:tetratricopeptide (TPR) repeat protein
VYLPLGVQVIKMKNTLVFFIFFLLFISNKTFADQSVNGPNNITVNGPSNVINSKIEFCKTIEHLISYIPFDRIYHFIQRHNDNSDLIIYRLDSILSKSQEVCIYGSPGSGKSTLALEYAHRQKEAGWKVRWFDASDATKIMYAYENIGSELGVKDISNKKLLINIIYSKLDNSEKYLFIFNKIENYDDVSDFINNLPKNVKVIYTTRETNLTQKASIEKLRLYSYTQAEAEEFIRKNLKRIKSDNDISLLVEKIGTNPKCLSLVVSWFDSAENRFKSINDFLLEKGQSSIHEFIFKYVQKKPLAWKLLQNLAYLDSDFTSIDTLKQILDKKSWYQEIKNKLRKQLMRLFRLNQESLNELIFYLESQSFIEVVKHDGSDGVKIHKSIQDEILNYMQNYPDKCDAKVTLLKNLSEILNKVDRSIEEKNYFYKLKNNLLILSIQKKLLVADDAKLAKYYNKVGNLYYKLGDYGNCFANVGMAINLNKTNEASDNLEIAKSYNILGNTYHELGEYKKSLQSYRKVMDIREEFLPKNHPDHAKIFSNIAIVYMDLVEYKKAVEYFQKAKSILELQFTTPHIDLININNNFGEVFLRQGDYKKALEYYRKALCIANRTLPERHIFAAIYSSLSGVYEKLGDYNKALCNLGESIQIKKEILPENHLDIAKAYNQFGNIYSKQGLYEAAIEYYNKVLDIRKTVLPSDHKDIIKAYYKLGFTYAKFGDYNKSLEFNQEAESLAKVALYKNNQYKAITYLNLCYTYTKLGDYKKALKYLDNANTQIENKVFVEDHPMIATFYYTFGYTYSKIGDFQKSLHYLNKAIEIRERILPKNHHHISDCYNHLGYVHGMNGDYKGALQFLHEARIIRERTLPKNHPDLTQSYDYIGYFYIMLNDLDKAYEYLEKARVTGEEVLPKNHPNLARIYFNLATLNLRKNNYQKAFKYIEKASVIREEFLPKNHPDILKTLILKFNIQKASEVH